MKIKANAGIYAYLICTLLPMVAQLTRGYFLLLICAFTVIVFWQRYGNRGRLPVLAAPFLCMFLLEMGVTLFLGNFGIIDTYSKFAVYLPVLLALQVRTESPRTARNMLRLIMLLHLIVAACTIIVLQEHPDASRLLATGTNDAFARSLHMRNTADYALVYTMALSFPLCAFACGKGMVKKWFFCVYAVIVVWMIISASYALAILTLTAALVICVLPNRMNRDQIILMALGILLTLLVAPGFLAWVLEQMAGLLPDGKVTQKLLDVAYILRGSEVSNEATTGRLDLYLYSWKKFLQSPLLGNWYRSGANWGGHSFLLDTLARYGVAGIALLVGIYSRIYRSVIAPMRNTDMYVTLLMVFILALAISSVNTGMWINVTVLYYSIFIKALQPQQEDMQ